MRLQFCAYATSPCYAIGITLVAGAAFEECLFRAAGLNTGLSHWTFSLQSTSYLFYPWITATALYAPPLAYSLVPFLVRGARPPAFPHSFCVVCLSHLGFRPLVFRAFPFFSFFVCLPPRGARFSLYPLAFCFVFLV